MARARPELADVYRYPLSPAGRRDCLRLDLNENVVGWPKTILKKMLSGITPDFLAAYPESEFLYEKIAKKHKVDVSNVLVTAGSEMAIRYAFEAFLDRGDEVILLAPSFAMFEVHAKLCGAKIVSINCNKELGFSLRAILESFSSRTKIIAIANPNNPTGSVFSESELFQIIDRAKQFQTLVLVDEAYFYFYENTMISHLDRYENLYVTRTFSKAGGIASARLGYAIGHASVIKEVMKLQPMDHANAFALKFGEYLMDHENLIWRYAEQAEAGKKFMSQQLIRLGFHVPRSYGNFILVDLGHDKEKICSELARRDILIKSSVRLPFENSYVRLTVGPVAQMKRVFNVILTTVKSDRRASART